MRAFSVIIALLGISDMPPYAIFAFKILFFLIKKLNEAHTEDISSSNLLEILYALKSFFYL